LDTQLIADTFLKWGTLVFIVLLCVLVTSIVFMFIFDRYQSTHAIKRNYPVIGRFRYYFEHLGGFFRQYFFAGDREEFPFNRAQRSWVYRAAKNIDDTVAFGSTRDMKKAGYVSFSNHPYPMLAEDATRPRPIIVGESCPNPWETSAFFGISAMSFGAISKPAIQALSRGASKAGVWMNTGEGGLSKYHLEGGADLIFQIGTAKYGVSDKDGELDDQKLKKIAKHNQVKMFEIKLSQGAKPGKGGILPGSKVTEEIAEARDIPLGQDSISPNRHKDIANNADLLNMVERIRSVTGKPVGFKMAVGSPEWIDELISDIKARGIERAPDFITIDSSDGGTGAAPMTLMDDMGLTIKESLPMLADALIRHQLKDRIKVFVSGKLINPTDVAWALCSGADFCCTARGFMLSLGCIQSLHCHQNNCPTGIATHDKKLQRGLVPEEKAKRVENYAANMMHAVEVIAHSCGVEEPRQLDLSHARISMDNGLTIPLKTFYENAVK